MSTSLSENVAVNAEYFDGMSAKAHPITLSFADGMFLVRGDTIQRDYAIPEVEIAESMQRVLRMLSFADGSHCQVRDNDNLARLLTVAGISEGRVASLQKRWRWAAASVFVTIVFVFSAYRWGLPLTAEWISYQIPQSVVSKMGSGTLDLLDRGFFVPTSLPQYRQAGLSGKFATLVAPGDYKPRYDLQFRNGEKIGANAMALPDGTLVVTDQLIALAADDEEILAVLAHELGHLNHQHSLRMVIEGSIVAFAVSAYIGDVGSIAAGIPTLLLQTRYSRDHESEADAYAAAMLKANGISPGRLADMLAKLEAAHRQLSVPGTDDGSDSNASSEEIYDYLSSHPATRDRIDALNDANQ